MKNTFPLIPAAVMAVCLAGCNSAPAVDITSENLAHTTVTIVGNPVTRATGVTSSEEENISNLQILVFDETEPWSITSTPEHPQRAISSRKKAGRPLRPSSMLLLSKM